MSNIHTIGAGNEDKGIGGAAIPSPWGSPARQQSSSGSSSSSRSSQNSKWGAGRSISGKTAENPWKNSSTSSGSSHESDSSRAERGGIHTIPASSSDYDPSTMAYAQTQPMISLSDSVWSDNLPPDHIPGTCDVLLVSCGCGCFVGPCCSETRKKDWCNVLKMFTFWISIVQLVMFIVSYALGGPLGSGLSPSTYALMQLGAKYAPYIRYKYHFHRLILPMFLHGGLLHYIFNMYFQFSIMFYKENTWGTILTGCVYVVSAIAGSIMSCCLYPNTISVGASGALLGIYGFFIINIILIWKTLQTMQKVSYVMSMIMFFVIMLIMGFTIGGIDQGAHLGGLLCGIAMGLIFLPKKHQLVPRIIGAVFFGIVFLVPFLVFYLAVPVAKV